MNKNIIIQGLIIFMFAIAQADQGKVWIENLENPGWQSYELKSENLKSKYIHYDFSKLLNPKTNFLGYIEPKYRRLRITFTSVARNSKKLDSYKIKGFSIVRENRCDFEGLLKIIQIREYKSIHYGCDEEFKDRGIKSQGLIIAEYVFNESKKQKFSGIFEGVMTLYWYVDKEGKIKYDDINSFSDSYNNNQYVGTWKQYNRKIKKIANWGEYRIPFSGDLDIGAGEFGANPRYYHQGWNKKD